jgi:glutathione S-transferase
VVTDDGATIAESGNIVEYLVERYGNGRLAPPAGSPERLRYRYWMHYAEGSMMPPLLLNLLFGRLDKGPMPFFVRPVARAIAGKVTSTYIRPNLTRHFDYLEGELTKSLWFAGGEFTAADVQMSFPVEAAAARAGLDAGRPRLMDWLNRIHAREAYKRAIERGGEYSILR